VDRGGGRKDKKRTKVMEKLRRRLKLGQSFTPILLSRLHGNLSKKFKGLELRLGKPTEAR